MIKIAVLVENTSISKEYRAKHGLCLYIETAKHKILFDLGQDDLFLENAKKMNIDISKVDTVIISHGHKDHGGGLADFLKVNQTAKIYMTRTAFEQHYIKVLGLPISVGLDAQLKMCNQIVFTEDYLKLDDELQLFSGVKTKKYLTKSNQVLYRKVEQTMLLDDFRHEQNLILSDGEKNYLLAGCAHAGIINIEEQGIKIIGKALDGVIGGFHLYNPPTRKYETNNLMDTIAQTMHQKTTKYYTCHCTSMKAYKRMKMILGSQLSYLATGQELIL